MPVFSVKGFRTCMNAYCSDLGSSPPAQTATIETSPPIWLNEAGGSVPPVPPVEPGAPEAPLFEPQAAKTRPATAAIASSLDDLLRGVIGGFLQSNPAARSGARMHACRG